MSVLLIAGSPSERSRSATLLAQVGQRLAQHRIHAATLNIRNLDAQALLQAQFDHPDVVKAAQQVANAKVIVVATPVYKAAYSGVLKVFIDLLAQNALKGKTVLPLATGGSPHHMLALDYALRPVLQSLGPRHILPGIYASDAQITVTPEGAYHVGDEIGVRLDDAASSLRSALERTAPAGSFEPIDFARVRCSV